MSREPDINMDIQMNEGMVVIGFNKPVTEVSMHSEMAYRIAEEIAKKANSAIMSGKPNAAKLADQIHGKMVTRLTHVIRGEIAKGKLPGYIAQQCVDIIFSEIF